MRDGLSDLHPSRIVARRMHELESELERARAWQRRYSKGSDTTGRWGLEPPVAPRQEESWFITYLDMMTLLLVVMVVMLAFSGSLDKQTSPLPGDGLQVATTVATNNAEHEAEQPPLPVSTASEPESSSADAPLPDNSAPATGPGGASPLPGGSGLLPETAVVAGAQPPAESTINQSFPADVGPLPRDQHLAVHNGIPQPGRSSSSSSELYPGWSHADLAASFIGPPRPAIASTHNDTLAVAATSTEEEPPSEGETLAAGLSLGELGNDVEVLVSERSVSFRVNSEILFDSSQADLSLSGLSVLRRIVDVLSSTNHAVTVEGHTDSVAVRRNARFPSNWELSSARAGSVVRYLQANGIERGRLKAVGYADTRPIADNHTPDGRASNRRVELIIEKRS